MEEVAVGLDISFKLGPALLMIGIIALFVIVGITRKVVDVDDYWVAGRSVGAIENGMAIGGNWMSAASFLGMAGTIGLLGFFGLAYIVGWTTGYFILLIFMATQIRKYGKYTAPDFIGDRYYSNWARGIAAVTTVIIGFVYAVAQYRGIALMFGYIFGMEYSTGVIVGTIAVISYILLAGMLGVTRNQAIQYAILIIAYLIPLFLIASRLGYFAAIPQIGYGAAVSDVTTEIAREFSEPFANAGVYQWIALAFTMIVGTCGLPHVLTRFYTVKDEKTSRWSCVWGLFFICVLYWSAPAYATFGNMLNFDINSIYPVTSEMADVIVVIAAQFADLPQFIVGALAAGAVAASFSTTSGLFMAASAGVSHDLFTSIIKPDATEKQQLVVARLTTLGLGVAVTIVALNPPALIADLVGMAFAIAGSTIFPVFFLGLWWERTTKEGAIVGMLVGLVISLTALFMRGHAFWDTWIPATSSAIVAAPLAFIIIIIVSKLTSPPPEEVRMMVRKVHSPTHQ
ncbi:VC_2705 family sodium/solute symporter [Fuchsiella alkaliacetigena]|uniref:VC_2705 family sodium/solute symporter n=1 Tax=Fuchsiella alkaliacetigena TaxID=957042 RepID=UPI00200AB0E3|nr:VC_2705 family sodium/solute symporter [Fuchsiella alkaliacetigena]MCK8823790.1 VC_2705 family sodium/solute symporter [Fuchsiella alkaliacetigena]